MLKIIDGISLFKNIIYVYVYVKGLKSSMIHLAFLEGVRFWNAIAWVHRSWEYNRGDFGVVRCGWRFEVHLEMVCGVSSSSYLLIQWKRDGERGTFAFFAFDSELTSVPNYNVIGNIQAQP